MGRSPAGYAAAWYSGAVTKDNKFIYGMGHSHASYNNNGLWTYDPATQQWTTIAQGDGWGNTGMLHSSGKLILMGGGINGPEDVNKQVWVGTPAQ